MAIPDKRGCFDFFRPYSNTSDFLAAFYEKRSKPTPYQTYQQQSMQCKRVVNNSKTHAWDARSKPEFIYYEGDIKQNYSLMCSSLADANHPYHDTHCWVLTPGVFELIIRDLIYLGLLEMKVDYVSDGHGCEFYARLVNTPPEIESNSQFVSRRNQLLQQIMDEPEDWRRNLPVPPVSYNHIVKRIWKKVVRTLAG